MHAGFIILVWLLNFGISVWNAYAVGSAWVETKHSGGWPRLIAWAGAVMSASGFSWCYMIVLVGAAYGLNWLTWEQVALTLQIGYILLIPGILSSGLLITLDSWAHAYRTRRIGDIGVAGWNTYAQIHNTFHAFKDLEKAYTSVVDSLSGRSENSDSKGVAFVLVFVIVIVAILSGFLTTAVIIRRVAGNNDLPDTSYGRPTKKK